ncbi:MAG: hypothetical protein HY075_10840, partial [Deltaproteobacteria bacterium]|nr:hypothetical protein [Deltaproteobacteria bacterium]
MSDDQQPDAPPPPQLVKESHRYSRTEKLAILLVVIVTAIMAYSYFADISLRELFFMSDEDKRLSTPIGTVTEVQGRVQRQRASEMVFKPLLENMPIYPNDTVLTGPDSSVTIVLKNGRTVRLTANSLVKFTYGAEMSKDGISVDVLKGGLADDAGRVVPLQGKPAPPVGTGKAPKVPMALIEALPASGTTLKFTEDEFVKRSKPVPFTFKLNRAGAMSVRVSYVEPITLRRVQVATAAAENNGLEASLTFGFKRPGTYEWQALDEDGKPMNTSTIVFKPQVQAIRALPTLNASNRLEGEAARASYDGPLLRWAPLEGPGAYLVRVYYGSATTPVFRRETVEPELKLAPKDAAIEKSGYSYTVEKLLPDGFLVSSARQKLAFELVAPSLTSPAAGAELDRRKLVETNGLIFFTWSKTNFTPEYEFELDVSPSFAKPLLHLLVRDNFHSQ